MLVEVLLGGTALVALPLIAILGIWSAATGDTVAAAAVVAPAPPPALPPVRDDAAEQREIAMFLAVPSAWWLDPNRWGDNPNWRDDLPRPTPAPYLDAEPPIEALAPECPVCGPEGQRAVMAIHGGEATMWDCMKCGAEFTRKGETKKSRKARLAREAAEIAERVREATAEEAKRLPCGCKGEVTTRSYPSAGFDMGRYALCVTCGGTWDYATGRDNYEGKNPRKRAPGSGPVEWPNGNALNDLPPSPAC